MVRGRMIGMSPILLVRNPGACSVFGFGRLISFCQKVIFGHLNPLQRFPNHIAVTSMCPDLDLRTRFPKQVALLLLTSGGVIKRLLVPRLFQLVQF